MNSPLRRYHLITLFWLILTVPGRALGQDFRITEVQWLAGNTLGIEYESQPGADFILLQGDTLTNITTPVMTNSGTIGLGQFSFQLAEGAEGSFFRVQSLEATTIVESSPANGESGVSVTRETIVRFSAPLAADTVLGQDQFYATFGGRRILSRVELASDRRKATLFYQEPLPGSARVSVVFEGENVRDNSGRLLDPNADGTPGGTKLIQFDTFSTTALAGTAVIGRVFASELVPGPDTGTNALNRPLEGVIITVDGREQDLRAVTDAQGNFKLDPVPPGRFFVHIDGRPAKGSSWPDGSYYPVVGKAWEADAGRVDNLAGGTGQIYLPLIREGTLQPVSAIQDTTITFQASVIANNPALAGVSITVPANSLVNDNGTRGGKVGIAPVPPDRLPGSLPPGLHFPLVVTVQTDGPQNFDRPVPVRFPNLPDPITGRMLAPGTKSGLWSYNHDAGQWEFQGAMTVTVDGLFVETDIGVGIHQPGWHGAISAAQFTIEIFKSAFTEKESPCNAALAQGARFVLGAGSLAAVTIGAISTAPVWGTATEIAAISTGIVDSLFAVYDLKMLPLTSTEKAERYSTITETGLSYVGEIYKNPKSLRSQITRLRDFISSGRLSYQADLRLARLVQGGLLWTTSFISAINAYSSYDDYLNALQQCFSYVDSQNRLLQPQDASAPSLEESAQLFLDSYDIILQLSFELIRKNLEPQIPFDVTLIITQRDGNVVVLNEDATPYINTDSGLPLSIPINELISDVDLNDEQLSVLAEAFTAMNDVLRRDVTASDKSWLMDSLSRFDDVANIVPHKANDKRAVVLVTDLTTGNVLLRSRTIYDSAFKFFGSLDKPFRVQVLSLDTETVSESVVFAASQFSCSGDSGPTTLCFMLPLIYQKPKIPLPSLVDNTDSDDDGISDTIEWIAGTDPTNSDSDGDGILDDAEIAQGTNPLDGRPTITGIIATAPGSGNAVDVCAVNDMAVLAQSDAGVAVYNVFNGLGPVRIVQVDTPGNAQRVACSGNLIAVADGPAGLAIIDISDPPNARVSHQIPLDGNTTAVATSAGIAYAATDTGTIVAVDLASGTLLVQTSVPGAVQDLGLGGDFLYALTTDTLLTLSIFEGELTLKNSVASPVFAAGNRRLFVGDTHLYAVQSKGANAFSLENPAAPTLVSAANTQEFGWRRFVPNGSGLALTTDGPNLDGKADVSLYDLNDPAGTTNFVTRFLTPGNAFSVSIYNGLAYVADGPAGLEVINYLQYDNLKIPPTISLATTFMLTSLTNGVAEEGKLVRVTAQVTDDVQVRNVEFYLDGSKVLTDGNFPFEHRFVTPTLSGSKTNFMVRAKATDTGGNFTWTDEITVVLTPDMTSPQARRTLPGASNVVDNIQSLFVFFSEPINAAALFPADATLTYAGADYQLGTADDAPVTGLTLSYREPLNGLVISTPAPLAQGLYHVLVAARVRDVKGNVIAQPTEWDLWVLPGGPDGDADLDDLGNAEEIRLGTRPVVADTDGDGWADGVEVADGKNPLDRASKPTMVFMATSSGVVDFPVPDPEPSDASGLLAGSVVFGYPPVEIAFPPLSVRPANNPSPKADRTPASRNPSQSRASNHSK